MMGKALLKRSDMSRYAPLMVDIRDQFGYGLDVYTKTLPACHDMLEDYARIRHLYPKRRKPKMPYKKYHRNKGEKPPEEAEIDAMYL